MNDKKFKIDERAKEMAKEALDFAMDNDFNLCYSNEVKSINFYFPKHRCISDFTYFEWENREERFSKMMNEASSLV